MNAFTFAFACALVLQVAIASTIGSGPGGAGDRSAIDAAMARVRTAVRVWVVPSPEANCVRRLRVPTACAGPTGSEFGGS